MPVELHHLACDITEGGNYFLPNVYIVFQRGKKKNVKGGLMILFPSTESKRKKNLRKVFFSVVSLNLIPLQEALPLLKCTFSFSSKAMYL